jgi:hypothetical protein
MAVSNERSVLATYFCCLITSKFAPPGRVAFRAWTTGMRPRLSAHYGSRPCTHKSRLVSSGWSLSALPPKADIRQRIEHVCFVPEADISAARQLSPLVPSADIDGGRRLTRHANDASSRVTYSHKLNPALFGDCFIRLVDRGDLLCRYEDELLRHATHH